MLAKPSGKTNRWQDDTRATPTAVAASENKKNSQTVSGLALLANQVAASPQLLANRTGHGRKYVI
jgi:hypothetical protein